MIDKHLTTDSRGLMTPMIKAIKSLFIACLSLVAFSSCIESALYEQYQAIENQSWEKNKEYYFTFSVEDISVPYDLFLEVRNTNLYPYQNLWVFSQQELPIGSIQKDTIECMLADDFGKWFGKGISIFQMNFPIRSNYYFPNKGQYTFSFRQGMRTDTLEGIHEIGFKVEKSRH
ncbi:gliding motility lipoprotein GldH [Parabacteroides sp. PF5-9]|uniref:gliding motility lipoprotein GldH n=1 Tax=Parabacteroides sp. PF5-9 TaxID=1742404 RepID=UPI002476EB70|nr:gliding motility lipoprotein GldH [Parabacteroides sp. PF5-9]MDH6359035.1 gliding motility-associated lipoprotein GldH [Parabacteroides sp. PF5-9]